ncbi:uncharacterized protein LOC124162990 [Ischnura elegans]|uniref:uncharacterized protein LOC124162990 n=1 Tax=Ischnura elegans TaxID=197161 RepID=UPI001ED8A779|nr:uncharacterized protein LOC124162990 [Ischnura elegans]
MSPKPLVGSSEAFPAPSSVADRIGLPGPVVSSGGTRPQRSPASGGATGGRYLRRMPTCGMLVTLLILMKAGVTLASVTTERTNQLPGHPTKSPHHHHHHLGHGRHGPEPHPGAGHAAAPTHNRHRLRHSGGNDVPCSKCPPGWGVIARCHPRGRGDNADAQWDTACAPCPKGFHSPHNSPTAECWPCSRCGPGLFESHPCTAKSDTVCDSCLTGRPRPLGADFDRKCLFGRSSGYFRWLSEDDDGGGEEDGDGMTSKRVQRMTSATAAAFRLSGQMRPRGEGDDISPPINRSYVVLFCEDLHA